MFYKIEYKTEYEILFADTDNEIIEKFKDNKEVEKIFRLGDDLENEKRLK